MPSIDPVIYYVLVVPDGRPEQATPLAGFSEQLCRSDFLLRAVSGFPTDVIEPAVDTEKVSLLARRANGLSFLNIIARSPRVVTSLTLSPERPFIIVMLGPGQNVAPFREWAAAAGGPVTFVAEAGGDLDYTELDRDGLRRRFLNVCDGLVGRCDAGSVAEVRDAIIAWRTPPEMKLDYAIGGHATVTPNLEALRAFGFADPTDGPFSDIKRGQAPYVRQIVLTSWSVLDAREAIPPTLGDAYCARSPALNLFAPAMYADLPVQVVQDASPEERRAFQLVKRQLERQEGYLLELNTVAQAKAVLGLNPAVTGEPANLRPHLLIRLRQMELSLATEAIGVLAASELGAVIRLPNGINLSSGAVRQFAAHYRGNCVKPVKALEAFGRVQRRLAESVPPEFLEIVRATPGDLRIVADAHLEWLDIDGVPLGLRRNVSRVPVTPGNLFVEQVMPAARLHLSVSDFAEVLVICALTRHDPIRPFMEIATRAMSPQLEGYVRLRFVEVADEEDLVAALNAFEGAMVIFDGHGTHAPGEPASLILKGTPVDVWNLMAKDVRIPPIVVLSACDTHAADRNHATTASGFLGLGARAVLASVFPLDARTAAVFAARLLYRVAAFLPAAAAQFRRSITWTETVSGMLRMQLATEFLRNLERKRLIDEPQYFALHTKANMDINGGAEDPFGELVRRVVEGGIEQAKASREFQLTVATSSPISYVHLGRPETITVDTPGHRAALTRMLGDRQ